MDSTEFVSADFHTPIHSPIHSPIELQAASDSSTTLSDDETMVIYEAAVSRGHPNDTSSESEEEEPDQMSELTNQTLKKVAEVKVSILNGKEDLTKMRCRLSMGGQYKFRQ